MALDTPRPADSPPNCWAIVKEKPANAEYTRILANPIGFSEIQGSW
jgi:hypothetical protein